MSDPLRIAVVGVRGIGGGHVKSVVAHERAELTAVVDLDAAAARAVADEHGARVSPTFDELLTRDDVDAVVLATPHHLHAPMSLAALQRGWHVYVEKPIATRIADADRVVAAARAAGRVLAVGHQYRSYPVNVRLKELLDSGAIGAVQRVVWQWLEARPETYYGRDPWRSSWEHAGGGVLLNQTSHDIDLVRWLFGPPAEVSAVVGNRGHAHEVEDTAVATVRFASGAIASLQFSTWDRRLNHRQIDGDAGAIVVHDEVNANVRIPEGFRLGRYDRPLGELIPDPQAGLTQQPEPDWEEVDCAGVPQADAIDRFVRAALDGGEPIADGASARDTTELIGAILLAGLRHRVVSFPVDRAAFDELMDDLIAGRVATPRLGGARA